MLYLGLTEKARLSLVRVFYQLTAGVSGSSHRTQHQVLPLSLSLTHMTGMQLRGRARPVTGKGRDWNKGPKQRLKS